jgi:succinate dehydrogenase flavin-adding protein (antitoxin of CptAB toxin-antitoxin module)
MHMYETRGDTKLIYRRKDGIREMDHSINPRNSRDAEQHTYETRGSSSLVVRESKSDIK